MATKFYKLTVTETVQYLRTGLKQGLSNDEVQKRKQEYGLNELEKEEKESIWEKIIEQFKDTLVQILLGSAVVSFLISQFEEIKDDHGVPSWVEPAVILSILCLNGFVAVYQDLDAEKALSALMDLQSPIALVLRDGDWKEVASKELVPGDVVQVSQGDKVPADLRMCELKTITLKIDQSTLTGETNPVNKITETIDKEGGVGVLDKINILFSSTLVVNGSAIGIVVNTGMKTEIGIIQSQVQEAAKEKKEEDSPLQQKLDEFGENLAKVITLICIVCWSMNIPNFNDEAFGHWANGAIYYFKVAVALAVAAIPEGLPAVITTCLALGTRRMAKQKAIIRKLQSVETLGCTTIICSDKTGTLTTNEMVVENFFLINEENPSELKHFDVDGHSYAPEGNIFGLSEYIKDQVPQNLKQFMTCMSLCNESKLLFEKDKVTRSGLPTEAALKVLNEKIGLVDPNFKNQIRSRQIRVEQYNDELSKNYQKLATLEFSRDRKSMSILVKNSNGKEILFIKGAPDYLLDVSKKVMTKSGKIVSFNQEDKKKFENAVQVLAKRGLRTLAICTKEDVGELKGYNGPTHKAHAKLENIETYAQLESDPVFIGVVALRDPPRPEVKKAIGKCKNAGISVIMITGDIKETAESIAKEISIINGGDEATRSFTGHQFEALDDKSKLNILQKVCDFPSGLVFSRTDPRHKRQLVQLLGTKKQIVAMTGDGVNDAPALKQAQIGIAMGITGTEVAKEASDMVLADDNFSTIVAAVEEGRAIYANMKAFIRYMISSNIGEVVSIFLSSLIGIPDGFNSVQLLWVNLVTDGLPATALSFNPPDPDVMKKPPRKHDEQLITKHVFLRYLIIGSYVGFATVFIFIYWYVGYSWAGDGHQLIRLGRLRNWTECDKWKNFQVQNFGKYDQFESHPCKYFTLGKQKASTLSLTVLVVIEMFNALNALSDESSLLTVGPLANPTLIFAIGMSISLHCMICYIPFFENVFNTVPLSLRDWILVLLVSFPVVLIDEFLKYKARIRTKQYLDDLKLKKD